MPSDSPSMGGSDSAVIADLLRQAQDDHQSIDALGREVSRLREALTMIAGMPTTERNPDGAEQAAWSMQLVAQEALNMGDTDAAVPCPICGRTDGEHEMTADERRVLRSVRWRAFWWGFTHPFSAPPSLDTMRRWRDEGLGL